MSNYKKIYEENFGIIHDNYIIHHIDHDHYNNNLINIVAINPILHQQYHNLYNRLNEYTPQTIIQNKDEYINLLNKFEEKYLTIMEIANNKYQ